MKFKEYILKNVLNQKHFVVKLGVSGNHINALYHGKTKPKLDLAWKIHKMTDGEVTFIDWLSEDDVKRNTCVKKHHKNHKNHKVSEE